MGRSSIRDLFQIAGNLDKAGLHGGVFCAKAVEGGGAAYRFGLEAVKEVFQVGEFGFDLGKPRVQFLFHGGKCISN
jgi:hypothetical protein